MIRPLTIQDKEAVLAFAYKHEHENLFIIGSFQIYKNPFEVNDFWGFFEKGKMKGLAVYFKRFGNLVINAPTKKNIEKLVDQAVKKGVEPKCIAAYKKYADPTINRLKQHKIIPKKISEETVFKLDQKDFNNFSKGEEQQAAESDMDEIILLGRIVFENNDNPKITKKDREKITPKREFIIKKDGKLVAKANIHGISRNYFQIGGVATLPEYRNKGYAKQVVSYLCNFHFQMGIPHALLFTDNNNKAAQSVYKKIGFNPFDQFVIADY